MPRTCKLAGPALLFALGVAGQFAHAQPALTPLWITNSSLKIQQLIGVRGATNSPDTYAVDTDRQTLLLLTNLTYTHYKVGGTDLGYSFEATSNRLIFLFGDTLYFNAHDTIAWSTSTDAASGLRLNFFTNSDGTALLVEPTNIDMGPFNVPSTGISVNGQNYVICKTGYTTTTANSNAFSVLTRFSETNNSFEVLRTVSSIPDGGHFIDSALHLFSTNILMFGRGYPKASAIYLGMVPANNFEIGDQTVYLAGLTNGLPNWTSIETNAAPLVSDNPTNPTIGNISVIYSGDLGLWLMTYNTSGGVYFSCASLPWGPWTQPQLIFNDRRDGGYGYFIHNTTNSSPPGPAGPTIGGADPATSPGGDYAPYMIERFMRLTNNVLTLYYTMSTLNPYTIVLMKSDFAIPLMIDPTSLSHSRKKVSFAWAGPTNASYSVDYSTNLDVEWIHLTNVVNSTNTAFSFTDATTNNAGLGRSRFYRLRLLP